MARSGLFRSSAPRCSYEVGLLEPQLPLSIHAEAEAAHPKARAHLRELTMSGAAGCQLVRPPVGRGVSTARGTLPVSGCSAQMEAEMFEKIKGLVAGVGDALGVEIPTEFGAVSDAVAQVVDVPGVSDVWLRHFQPGT